MEQNNKTTKLTVKVINTFDKIIPIEKSLILCDIDDTVLRYNLTFKDFYSKVKNELKYDGDYLDEKDINDCAMEEFNLYREKNVPFHTDGEGFRRLEQKILKTNSKLCFITSRSKK